MKTVVLIFSAILLLAGAGMGFMSYNADGKDLKDVEEVYAEKEKYMAQFSAEETEAKTKAEEMFAEQFKNVPSPGRLKAGSYLGLLLLAIALGTLVLAFVKPDLLKIAVIATTVVGMLAYLVHPYVKKGEYSGLSGKSIVLIAAGLAIAGALGTLYARYNSNKVQA